MNKILLPIDVSSPFISRFDRSICFNIARAQASAIGKDITPWLVGRLANLQFCAVSLDGDNMNPIDWYLSPKLFYKKTFHTDDRMPHWNNRVIRDMLIQSIQRGEYIQTTFNTYYLEDDLSYGAYSRFVEVLIYGYDDTKKEFYYIRPFFSNPFSLCSVSYDKIVKAICEKDDHQIVLDSLRFNTGFVFELDEKALCRDLFNFITPRDKFSPVQQVSTPLYGVDYLKEFRKYLCRMGIDREYIDRDMFSVFCDFQTMMCMRYKYLKENGYLLEETYDAYYVQLPKLSKQFLDGCFSYNQKHNADVIKEIIGVYDQIVEIDLCLSRYMWRLLRDRIKE